MKKFLLIFCAFVVISSCRPIQLIFDSKYVYSPLGYSLILSHNNTFQYEEFMGWGRERVLVSGTWTNKENKLFLHSYDTLMQNPLPLNIKESMVIDEDSLKFILYVPQSNGYINWVLVLNDIPYSLINDSLVNVEDTSTVKRLYLKAERNQAIRPLMNRETVQTQVYVLQNKNSNLIELSIPLTEKEIYRYASYELLNDTLTIKNNKLLWPRKNVVLKYQK